MRILLTGKNGQVGFELQRALAPLGEVVAVGHRECDLADEAGLRALIREIAPDIIVNPAAYTAVDRAESDSAACFAVNSTAVRVMGEEASRLGALVVHFSTDYVFNGEKTMPYRETDEALPKNVYGRSKLEGELALAGATPDHLIFRTSWVFGARGNNFVKTMLRLAGERDGLSVVADQMGAPTSASLLADITALVLQQYQRQGKEGFPFGLYHLTAAGETSWYDYARFVIESAQARGVALKATQDSVSAVLSVDYRTAAARPLNSRLDTTKFRDAFSLYPPSWQSGVSHMLLQIL